VHIMYYGIPYYLQSVYKKKFKITQFYIYIYTRGLLEKYPTVFFYANT